MSTCTICDDPLVFRVHDDEDDEDAPSSSSVAEEQVVPDSVMLKTCGCKFHWQCLLDEIQESGNCPHCSRPAGTQGQILCSVNNEGGAQEEVNIFADVQEELFTRAHPEQRVCRAFLTLCKEGDVPAIAALLQDATGEDGTPTAPQIVHYQDPLNSLRSGLHVAVLEGQRNVLAVLLFLASSLPLDSFPPEFRASMASELGLQRLESQTVDIRALKDGNGNTAADLAQQIASWADWVRNLAPPP